MKIEVNGVQYSDFVQATTTQYLDSLSSIFSFKATAKDGAPLPFRGGEACKITVDGELTLTGYIELVNSSGNDEEHSIDISGRDKTGDLIDSMIDSLSDIRAPISLKSVIEKIVKHLGTDLTVIDNLKPKLFNKAEDLAAPEPGQKAWDFIESLARKRQALLTSDPNGNIVITQASGEFIDATLQNKIEDDANNVLTYSVSYDSTGRYNVYSIAGQLNPLAILTGGASSNSGTVSQIAKVTDPEIRKGRQFVLIAEKAGSASEQKDRATWEANVRKARGRVYGATVDGFRNQLGELWAVNKIIKVEDEFAGINARMLVNTVQFSLDEDGGRQTTLALVERDAYTLKISEPEAPDELGVGLF